jgi:hypothetical protein
MSWQRLLVCCALTCSSLFFPFGTSAQESPPGKANDLREQLEKLQNELRAIELKDEQRGKVTEIGSSRGGRLRNDDEPRLVVKVYDLSDLFTIAPSYPAYEPRELFHGAPTPVFPYVAEGGASGAVGGGGFGGGGGGLFAVPNLPRAEKPASIHGNEPSTLHQGSGASGAPASNLRTSMDSLIETITTTIDPEGWAEVGGKSSISPVGSSLLISTTPETHAKLTALIDLFRQRWGSLRTISVQAHWLWLTPSQVDESLVQPKAGEAAGVSQVSLNSVSAENWKKLLASADKQGAPAPYHAIITCYNGQTVAAQAGTQRIAVTGINPVVGGEKAIGYAPQVRNIHEGATLQITPLATRHVKYVVLDVHSRVNILPTALKQLQEKVERVIDNDPQQVVEALDRTVLQTQRLETTLRLPVGQPTLIGGMTFAGAEGKTAHLYLFITAKVQELRDEEPPVTAPAAPAPDKGSADARPKLNEKPIAP